MHRMSSPPLSDFELPAATGAGERWPEPPALPLLSSVLRALLTLHVAGPAEAAGRASLLSALCTRVCELHSINVEVSGPRPRGPVVVVANHLGYIDPIVLCSLFPCSPIAKQEIASWAVVGTPLERLNVSFVRRADAHSGARVLRRSAKLLRAGINVLNFPEGTTTRGELGPFRLGAFWLARHSGVPIVPIGIDFEDLDLCWVDDAAFLPHYGRLWPRRRRNVRVCIGDALEPHEHESELDLAFAARRSIVALRGGRSAVRPIWQ